MVLASLPGILSWGPLPTCGGGLARLGPKDSCIPPTGTLCAQPGPGCGFWPGTLDGGPAGRLLPARPRSAFRTVLCRPRSWVGELSDAAPHLLSSCFQSLWILGCSERPRWAGPPRASETILPFGSRATCPGPEPSLDIPPLASEGSEAVGLRGLPHPRRFMFQLLATPSWRTLCAPQKAPLALRDRASWGHVIERGLGDPLPRPPLRLVPLEAGPLTTEPASHAGLLPPGNGESLQVWGLSFFFQPLSLLIKKPWHVFICFFF